MAHTKNPSPLVRKGVLTNELAYLLERDENAFVTEDFVLVESKERLPPARNGVHYLDPEKTYMISGIVDLEGNCIVGAENNAIIGSNTINSKLMSTGLSSASPLIKSNYSLPMKDLIVEAPLVFDLDATANPQQRILWDRVEFRNCPDMGTVKSYELAIFTNCLWRNCAELVLDGTFSFILFSQCIYEVLSTGGTGIILPSTISFQRFRMHTSAVVLTDASSIGIDADVNLTCGAESYIIQSTSFAGLGTPLTGLNADSNKSLFLLSRGIENSSTVSHYFWVSNATPTVIAATNTFVKAAGTSTPGPFVRKFTITDNRATYVGAFDGFFRVSAVLSVTAGNAQEIIVRIARNGVPIPNSEMRANTPAAGIARAENIKVQAVVAMTVSQGDYIEVWVANATAITNIVVVNLNVILDNLNS